MSVLKTLFGTNYTIPESREKKWGPATTSVLTGLIDGVDGLATMVGGVPFLSLPSTTQTLSDNGTLTPTTPWHRISGTPGAVELSTITAIGDGSKDGQLLVLTGTSATNTVVVPDGANTILNGEAVLGLHEALVLIWCTATGGDWIELFRSF
jgi:hypothetical protein